MKTLFSRNYKEAFKASKIYKFFANIQESNRLADERLKQVHSDNPLLGLSATWTNVAMLVAGLCYYQSVHSTPSLLLTNLAFVLFFTAWVVNCLTILWIVYNWRLFYFNPHWTATAIGMGKAVIKPTFKALGGTLGTAIAVDGAMNVYFDYSPFKELGKVHHGEIQPSEFRSNFNKKVWNAEIKNHPWGDDKDQLLGGAKDQPSGGDKKW